VSLRRAIKGEFEKRVGIRPVKGGYDYDDVSKASAMCPTELVIRYANCFP
jgi:hypothetical protein